MSTSGLATEWTTETWAARWTMRSTGPCWAVSGASALKMPCETSQATTSSWPPPAWCARLLRFPVRKSSSTMTRWPAPIRRSTVWDPMKPAPPVTTASIGELYMSGVRFALMRAIQIQQFGGPEVMQLVELPVGEPGPGEVRVRHHACGINFIDIYHRTGLYPMPMPALLGTEAAGVVDAVGAGVTYLGVGDRVAYTARTPGSYAEARVVPALQVVKLPD